MVKTLIISDREAELLYEAIDMLLDTWHHGEAEDYDMTDEAFEEQINELALLCSKLEVG